MSAQTRVGVAHYHTDCLSCGAVPSSSDTGSAHRSWAVRHVEKNPTHEVHVTLERVLRVTGSRWTP